MKKRSRAAKPRAKRDVGVADGPTPEWRQHHDAVVENRDIKGTRGIRALSQNAFDRYYRRVELAPGDKKENTRLYMAGERLRGDWELSGLDTLARPSFERRAPSNQEDFSDARIDAYDRVRAAMIRMGPTKSCVVNCCVYGEPVGQPNMQMLRAGLGEIAQMYFGRT